MTDVHYLGRIGITNRRSNETRWGVDEMARDFRPLGQGRYRVLLRAPWGQEVAAELILSTPEGWAECAEAGDRVWVAYTVGPVVMGIKLVGDGAQAEAGQGQDGAARRRRVRTR